jgi:hypothetical protein
MGRYCTHRPGWDAPPLHIASSGPGIVVCYLYYTFVTRIISLW